MMHVSMINTYAICIPLMHIYNGGDPLSVTEEEKK